jgi:hypothetical protein
MFEVYFYAQTYIDFQLINLWSIKILNMLKNLYPWLWTSNLSKFYGFKRPNYLMLHNYVIITQNNYYFYFILITLLIS